ncbi:GL20803 [Drosophila persimilis]|uniref:GL20803 n=1 Tax=Drosophila persimilis TaxID=7234 RepID=B4H444_DROPE|nr:GL20803 [Drosophila persimilis]
MVHRRAGQRDASVTADIGATNAKYGGSIWFSKWLGGRNPPFMLSWQKYFREMVKGNSEDHVQGNTEDPAHVNSEDPVPLEPDTTPSPGAIKDLEKEKTGRENLFLKLEKTKAPLSIESAKPQGEVEWRWAHDHGHAHVI